ncbi:MAG TPA: orotate phosphoribosyltransferase [Pirellulaceae bacterium]|nr:orotate phosphoribosyltransferase [Pirellulaceae bacterium]HMO93464.1 orotate phosphoribosyltransferase [Pirellulaceae bacterium]HMP69221.1 orotate phosphoribosyltransferase [Pirellulaceae bacterium]
MYNQRRLIELVKQHALKLGNFTLASGKQANFYLDCRKLTLTGEGANLIAHGMLDHLGRDLPDAVGGMAIGADPITAALVTVAYQQGKELRGFIVRKEAKAHGTGQEVEGPVRAGDRVVIVEDTVTTGGSSMRAVEKAQAFGLVVTSVLAVIDRCEGAAEFFRQNQLPFHALLTIQDLGIDQQA